MTKMPVKQKAIIVDIDGTIADINHRLYLLTDKRTNRKWEKFYSLMSKDKPKKDVLEIIQNLWPHYEVIFVTGRPEKYRKVTEKWIHMHAKVHYFDKLLMRPDNDYTQDDVLKGKIYERDIKPHYDVIAVFDDRPRIIEMFEKKGLTCFQVGTWKEVE